MKIVLLFFFSNVGDGKFMNNLRFFYFSLTLDRKLKFIY